MKASMTAEVAKSLARVAGGLYVITAANKSARGAMLASWVAQASFEPLGLTVAVAKDRAIESLMQVRHLCICDSLVLGHLLLGLDMMLWHSADIQKHGVLDPSRYWLSGSVNYV